jgi:hypothetical protein
MNYAFSLILAVSQHFQGLRRAQNKAESNGGPGESSRKLDPTMNPITRRPGPGRGRPKKQSSEGLTDSSPVNAVSSSIVDQGKMENVQQFQQPQFVYPQHASQPTHQFPHQHMGHPTPQFPHQQQATAQMHTGQQNAANNSQPQQALPEELTGPDQPTDAGPASVNPSQTHPLVPDQDENDDDDDTDGPVIKRQRLDDSDIEHEHDAALEDDPVLALASANSGGPSADSYHPE